MVFVCISIQFMQTMFWNARVVIAIQLIHLIEAE